MTYRKTVLHHIQQSLKPLVPNHYDTLDVEKKKNQEGGRKAFWHRMSLPPDKTMPLFQRETYRLGQATRFIWVIHYFIKEDGEVEGKTQADGVGGGHLLLSNVCRFLVGLHRPMNMV